MNAQQVSHIPLPGVLMTMKEALNKFEAGALVKKRREERGLTQDDVVNNTTIPVATYVSELENGKVSVGRSKHFASLASYLKLSEADIRSISPGAVFEFQPTRTDASPINRSGMKVIDGARRVPVLGFAAAGHGAEMDPFAQPYGYDYVDPKLDREHLLILQVDGESMHRSGQVNSIESGDWIYVDTNLTNFQDGKIFVVDIEGQGVVVKRVRLWPQGWVLVSDNQVFPPFMPSQARVIGRVFYRQPKGEGL